MYMASMRFSTLVVLLLCCSCISALARQLQAKPAAPLAPVQIGDGTRVLRKSHMQAKGGAIAALGRPVLAELKRKARFSGTVQQLAKQMDTDSDLGVDAVNKALMFVCAGLTASNADVPAASSTAAAATEIASGVNPSASDPLVNSTQVFRLSSRPTATKKIFLDFDGHITTGSDWNGIVGRDIVSPPYDKDGIPSQWSDSERADIVAIWRAVSEDYAMFDVDVTTADPGEAALLNNGVRVVIGGSFSDWWGSSAGGIAYVGRFGTANLPAFVFPQNLGPNNAKFVWEAISHEAGHMLGLTHDTTATTSYYSGQGNWAPIMGSAYYKQVSTFDKGEFTGATNQQDDLATIGGFLPLLPQQYGNSLATASPLAATVDSTTGLATAKVMGVVASAAGDWFSFTAAAGQATLTAAVMAPGVGDNKANLNIQLTVYNAAGAVVASLNPAGPNPTNGLGVPATAVALPAAGTYYIAITGAGEGDVTQTGYSSYASRGQFELTAVYPPLVVPASPSPAPITVDVSPSPAPITVDVSSSPAPITVDVSPSPAPITVDVSSSPAPQAPESSPSPSPVVPSPSPSPSPVLPSPSPSPMPAALRVSIGITRIRTAGTCSVSVTVRNAAGAALSGVRVNGQWIMAPAGATATTTFTRNVNTGSVGTASFSSPRLLSAAGSCTFTVMEASLAGYYFDTVNSVMSRTVSW